jgi:hypothetical protein
VAALIERIVKLKVGAEARAHVLTESPKDGLPELVFFKRREIELLQRAIFVILLTRRAPAPRFLAKVSSFLHISLFSHSTN